VPFERENLHWFGDELLPASGVGLDGLSGGPVLAIHDSQLPLVGIISDGGVQFELIYVRTLSSFPAFL